MNSMYKSGLEPSGCSLHRVVLRETESGLGTDDSCAV